MTNYVRTRDAEAAVKGRELDVLRAVGIDPPVKGHMVCPYPAHGGKDDWRWDSRKAKAYCTCIDGSHSIFDVVATREGVDFERAKVRAAEILGRTDLIHTKSDRTTERPAGPRRPVVGSDPGSLLNAPDELRDDTLPVAYLAHRLGIPAADVPPIATPTAGISELGYFDPPATERGKPKLVGNFPCAVFGTVAVDGRRHAHRIYVGPQGAGKADLGTRDDGTARDPKKSARAPEDGTSTAGCAVLWGSTDAPHVMVAEGIETASAVAHAHRAELDAGGLMVVAAVTASGLEAWTPYQGTQRVTVAADRDEAPKADGRPGSRTGERGARRFGLKHRGRLAVFIALPGVAGTSADWLDVLRADGPDAVRAGIAAAEPFAPNRAELEAEAEETARAERLYGIAAQYPVPEMMGQRLAYIATPSGEPWLHRFEGRDKRTGEEQWTPLCSPVGIIARLRRVDDANAYGVRVRLQDMAGQPRELDFDREELAKMGGAEIRSMLFAHGLRSETMDGDMIAVTMLKAAAPPDEIAIVGRPGWHEMPGADAPAFVCPSGQVIGRDGAAAELTMGQRLTGRVASAGSLDAWKEAVAAAVTARDCLHWTIGAAAGFAGVVLSMVGLDTCGMSLSGMSSSGKSTAQRLAASAWGSPSLRDEALFRSMRVTENAVEGLCQRASGTILALDELGHADGRAVGRLIYSIASGVGKARMRADASMRTPYRWSTFALLSAERALEDVVRSAGGSWQAGMSVRVVDVDITGVNRAVPTDTLAAIEAIGRNYGHAGPAFVAAAIEAGLHVHGQELRDTINAAAADLAGPNAEGARVRAALPFAVVNVAGELAKRFRLLPQNAHIKEAVQWAWGRYLDSSGARVLSPEADAVDHMRRWLIERWDVTVRSTDGGAGNREAIAWYDNAAVYLPTARAVEAAGGSLKQEEVRRILVAGGHLARREGAHASVSYIPRIGKLRAYALRRDTFGRSLLLADPEGSEAA